MMATWTRRRILRLALLTTASSAIAPLIAACGQPDPSRAKAARAGAQQTAPGTPAPTSGTPVNTTPLPTVAGTVVLPTPVLPPNTGPQLKPTLPPITVTPLPPQPTKRPDEPYQRTISPTLPAPDTARTVPAVALVVIGTASEMLPARWTTSDGMRPANPHAGPSFYTIFTPVRVRVERVLKGSSSLGEVVLALPGGQVGQDYVRIESRAYVPFQPGERTVLFLNPASSPPDGFNGSALWEIWERYTIEGEMATHPARTVPLQQLIAEINAALGTPTPTPGATPVRP